MADLAATLADVFRSGLDADPKAHDALVSALAGAQAGEAGVTKAEANYRPSETSGESCSTCTHFDGDMACEVVSGTIDPNHVSDHWEAADGQPGTSPADGGTTDGG